MLPELLISCFFVFGFEYFFFILPVTVCCALCSPMTFAICAFNLCLRLFRRAGSFVFSLLIAQGSGPGNGGGRDEAVQADKELS